MRYVRRKKKGEIKSDKEESNTPISNNRRRHSWVSLLIPTIFLINIWIISLDSSHKNNMVSVNIPEPRHD